MTAYPQLQSAFVTRLPREIRDLIYLELWRSAGLRQHILWHNHFGEEDDRSHFYRWPCSTEFRVDDPLQEKLEDVRVRHNKPLGKRFGNRNGPRLRSPWRNHWACHENAMKVVSGNDDQQDHSVLLWNKYEGCFMERLREEGKSPYCSSYMPMLLSCKFISGECLESIYSSTTFILPDVITLQLFLGFCKEPPHIAEVWHGIPPPALFKHTRHLEISVQPDFPVCIACADPELTETEDRHEVYDFHWLYLDKFQSLCSIKMWIPSCDLASRWDKNYEFTCINHLDLDALRDAMRPFLGLRSFTLSAPLHESIKPEGDDYVEGLDLPAVAVWKRGTGARFHTFPWPSTPSSNSFDDVVSSATREVRIADVEKYGSRVV